MLKKYLIKIKNPYKEKNINANMHNFNRDFHSLWNSLFRITWHKSDFKKELGSFYFSGMRENWFPLILLGKYGELCYYNDFEKANEILEYFKILSNNEKMHSFYIDSASTTLHEITLVIKCKGNYDEFPILEIFNCFSIVAEDVTILKL